MSYELVDPNNVSIFTASTFDELWKKLHDYEDAGRNLDHFIVKDHKHHSFDYAWRVLRNMNDLTVY